MMDSDVALLIAACASIVIAITVIPGCCGGRRPEKKQKKKRNSLKPKEQSGKSTSLSMQSASMSVNEVAPQVLSPVADLSDFTEKEQSTQQMSESSGGSDLILEPGKLKWSSGGGLQRVTLSNPTNERRAVKAKCSDNSLYRVNPVFAFIEPGQCINVDIVRDTGNPKVDKMVFVYAKATAEDIQPKSVFKPGASKPSLILPLIATTS
uniref:Major sperm protein n=1 Tax=Ascaris lumbricoides TaxID=6252 RepID=A0A0M3IKQ3_ASCLU